ncbi:MAG: metalloregulator ArsR/SmtB family transcription factor [Pseudomonadota bacterium]
MPPRADKPVNAVKAQKKPPTDLASVFFALGDKTRLELIAVLCVGGAFSIAQLTANTDLTRQAVTKHLQVLSDAGLVRDLKMGRERLWQFDPAQMEEARKSLEAIGQQWESALGRLKQFVEEG